MEREKSSIWQVVFSDLWKQGMTRTNIAEELSIPETELDSLLFGLTTDVVRPDFGDTAALRIVE